MRVCVIGAGPGGLCSGRHLLELLPEARLELLERSHTTGGIWTANNTPIYDDLHTNLAQEIMAFPDFPFPPREGSSFPHHTEVATYLDNYSKHHDLEKYVKFGREVICIRPTTKQLLTQWQVHRD